jgi:hypothetical protein
MSSLLSSIGAWFVEPPRQAPDTAPSPRFVEPPRQTLDTAPSPRFVEPPRQAPDTAPSPRFVPPTAARSRPPALDAGRSHIAAPAAPAAPASSPVPTAPAAGVSSAAVLGGAGVAVPVAAACAGELRARAKAAAALLCIWRPPAPPHHVASGEFAAPSAESPAGATTPGARRLATRLAARGLPATACGRLAWLRLEPATAAAAEQVRRCLALAGVPVVLAVAGARPPAFEPLLAELDLAIAVLPPDIEPALRELALVTLPAPDRAVLPPLLPGPPRWAAMAGLARLRSLPRGEP